MTQTWDPGHTCANDTLSGGNLIATQTSNAGSDSAIFGLNSFNTGRFYWEILVTSNAVNVGVGIGNINSPITSTAYLGSTSDTISWFVNGNVDNNAVVGTNWATYVTGNTVCLALDLVSNKLWGRVGAAGNWANDVIGNQNPAVGSQVGGFAIPAGVLAAAVVPAGGTKALNDAVQGKFASASWIGTPPTGFVSFDAASGSGLGRTLLMGVGGSIVRRDFRSIRALLGGRES